MHGSGDGSVPHEDLSRTIAQTKFLKEKNFNLTPPLTWKMYGKTFEIRS